MYWSEKHSVCQWGIKCAWQSIQEPAGCSVAIDISACHVWILFPFLQSTVTTYCDFPVKLYSLLGSNRCSCIQVLFICKKKKKVFMFVLTSEVSFTTDKMLVETSVLVASALWACGSRVLWIPQWCLLYLPLVLLSFGTFLWHSGFLFWNFWKLGHGFLEWYSCVFVLQGSLGSLNLGPRQSEGWVKKFIKRILNCAKGHAWVLRVSSHWIVHGRSGTSYCFFHSLPWAMKLHGIWEYKSY